MPRLFILDASTFKLYYSELIEDIAGLATEVVHNILQKDFIATDNTERMLHEWVKCCCGDQDEFLRSWFRARAEEDKIRILPYKAPQGMKAQLDKFGVPQKDRSYLFFAAHHQAYMVISEDIDFFDPKAKKHPHLTKQAIKKAGSGCVCKYMKATFSVVVCELEGVTTHI